MLLEKIVIQYRPSADHDNLKELLTMVGTAEQYLATIQNPIMNTSQPPQYPLFTPVSPRPLHPGVLMDVDHKKYSGTSTRPQAVAIEVCYNCQQPGHITANCNNPKVIQGSKFLEFERLDELKALQRNYNTYQ